jgi:hypothetical protein
LIVADNQREAKQVAGTFQTKIVKYLESTLGSADGIDQTRIKLATYTASHAAFGDLTKMMFVLRARDALAKCRDALPAAIDEFDNTRISKITELLDDLGKTNTEDALRAHIDRLDESDWGERLNNLMKAIAALVEAEVSRFPDHVDHVLASHNLRSLPSQPTLAGRLTNFWRGKVEVP